jgi:uncharacterized protein YqgC (DUF456 family)
MNAWKLSRGDWSLTNVVLALVTLLAAIPLALGLRDWITGRPLLMQTGAVVPPPPVDDPHLVPGVSGVYTGQAIFTIENATTGQWLYWLLVPVITLVTAVVCVWMVARVVRHARQGDPFNPQAHLSLRVLGLVLFCYGLFTPLISFLMTAMITTGMRGGEFNMALEFDARSGWPVLVGLVVGVVGESVFGRGRKLAEDAEGLI